MPDPLTALAATLILGGMLRKLYVRLQLSFAKHPSVRGHAKWSRRLAKLVPNFGYSDERFFCSDDAPAEIENARRTGYQNLLREAVTQSPKSIETSLSLAHSVSDIRFTNAYRVPFPYRDGISSRLKTTPIVEETDDVRIKDIDGTWRYDLSGSYGLNVFGYDFYKQCLAAGAQKAEELGPVLGPYHPLLADNVAALKRISGLDEVSFHMSGTEAVMQAVRLARYHTTRTHLVRLCGAYHGWWDGVQPGVGNRRSHKDIYTLADLSEHTLRVLRTRKDIACVLINPMQAFHPNRDSASDASLLSSARKTDFDKEKYTKWLQKIREICTARKIVLIFDEVFTGFRLGKRGAQEYFGIHADMVTYGKTVGGGLPIGVVCGRSELMQRYRGHAPADVSLARGTFNSHPYVLGAMHEVLQRVESDELNDTYGNAERIWTERVERLNRKLTDCDLPVALSNMHSVISVSYTTPSRYNWMFQFYLRNEGLELAWIGSGRFIMSLAYSDVQFDEVEKRFISAAEKMKNDGWWWADSTLTNQKIVQMFVKDLLISKFKKRSTNQPVPNIDVSGPKIGETVSS